MKDTNQRTNRLSIAAIFFVLVIIIGFITLHKPEFEFKVPIDQALDQVLSFEDEMTPEKATDIVSNNMAGYQFVDVRNPYEFAKGHIETAINISSKELLASDNVALFDQMTKDSVRVILYGYNQSEANGSWMILKQLGYKNVKILLGGYEYYSGEKYNMFSESEIPQYMVEQPKYNFAALMEELSDGNSAIKPGNNHTEVIIPERKKKKSKVEGGC
ncbi:MAG: hypothetical protein CVU00_00500 [Bacteroidetes bacterium HGW-Bacteroidetes-17]|jgi:rhodanese-related sulfurtransferase|nr:MAG: hypothetical protein CVU00_00500 [Bacteroidetes bacterium HGW-Bacteroidetes-17]